MKTSKTGIYPIFTLLCLLFFGMPISLLRAQDTREVSLKEAQQYALEHNYQLRNAETDIDIAKKKVSETTTIGLPQINGKASNTNYIDIPTTLLPDFITPSVYGVLVKEGLVSQMPQTETQFFPAQFGTEHNVTLEASASQLIFSGSYLVGLQAAKAYVDLSKSQLKKSEIDVKYNVANAYYTALTLQENKSVLDSTLQTLQQMLYETKELYKSGFIEDTDVDQLELLVFDLKANMENVENQLAISYDYLKFLMGMPVENNIFLTEDMDEIMKEVNRDALLERNFEPGNNINYKLVQNQLELAELQVKNDRTAYLPTVNAFYSYQQNAMRSEWNFFESGEDWYQTQLWGFQVDIPLFSSFGRHYKIQQSKLEVEKSMVAAEQVKENLRMEIKSARSEFNNAYSNFLNKKRSLDMAENIYNKTQIKYKEGISSSLDLSQAYNQYLQSEVNFLNARMELMNKKSNLDKILEKE